MIEFRIQWPVSNIYILKPKMTITGRKELLMNYDKIKIEQCYVGSLCDSNNIIRGLKINVPSKKDQILFCIDIHNNQKSNDQIQVLDNGLTESKYTKYIYKTALEGQVVEKRDIIGVLVESKIKEVVI